MEKETTKHKHIPAVLASHAANQTEPRRL